MAATMTGTENSPAQHPWQDSFICEVGAARSGTNFLGEVLSQHPALAYWRRPKYIWRHGNAWKPDDCLTPADASPRVVRYIHRKFGDFLRQSGRERLLVCTQANILSLDFVNAVFPRGKIVHIIRDGREVAASQAKEWEIHNSLTKAKGSRPPYYQLVARRVAEVPPSDLPAYLAEFLGTTWTMFAGSKYRYSMGPKIRDWRQLKRTMDRLEFTALTWRECVSSARAVGRQLGPERYYEVKFEDVVHRPRETVPALLEFLELPPSPEIERFIEHEVDPSVSGKWFDRISQRDLEERILPYVGDLCRELGYLDG
ncbi:MAG: sulfotransferase [Pirellulales bacterium]|nr:sulfotransferase [Pirellulales bacterium]